MAGLEGEWNSGQSPPDPLWRHQGSRGGDDLRANHELMPFPEEGGGEQELSSHRVWTERDLAEL